MYVLPLGITFMAILQAAASETRYQKLLGAILSFFIVVIDCVFYFAQNSFIVYNCDGGLLLSFASLFITGFIFTIKSDDRPSKVGHILFSLFMFVAFIGIAYWDRPTFVPTQDYSPAEIAEMNAKYQDYIASFSQNGDKPTTNLQKSALKSDKGEKSSDSPAKMDKSTEGALNRLNSYQTESQAVIERMLSVVESILKFEKIAANVSEQEREDRGRHALAISNNAVAINKKVLGLFHPLESSETHAELIQASESLRLAAYSLYNYAIQENPEEQDKQYDQAMNQINQTKAYLERFKTNIETLKTNYKQQTTEEQ